MNAFEMAMLDSDNSKAPSSPNHFKFGILVLITTSITSVIVSWLTLLLSGGFCGSPSLYNRTEFESLQARLENQSQHIQDTFPSFKKNLEDIQEHLIKQAMNFTQEIQSQANTVEEKANKFATLVDQKNKQMNHALELLSQEHSRSAEVLEEMKKKISDIQEHLSKQDTDFKKDIQSQVNTVEEKTNKFATLVDTNTAQINHNLESLSQEHGKSAKVLEDMKKKISDIQEAQKAKEETVERLQDQIMTVSTAHTERWDVIDTRLDSIKQLMKDLQDELEEVKQEVGTNATIN